jgi:hypothetical protein
MSAEAEASFLDHLTIHLPVSGLPPFQFNGFLNFTGAVTAISAAVGYPQCPSCIPRVSSGAAASVYVNSISPIFTETAFHHVGPGLPDSADLPDPIQTKIPFSLTITPNVEFLFHVSASASSQVEISYNTNRGSATGAATGNFANTLSWGGITSISNAMTGEPIEGWTITSESGFDYSLVFLIPEPSSHLQFAVAIVGIGALGSRWGQRKRRAECA